jgi:prophage maintenance system killer protein
MRYLTLETFLVLNGYQISSDVAPVGRLLGTAARRCQPDHWITAARLEMDLEETAGHRRAFSMQPALDSC